MGREGGEGKSGEEKERGRGKEGKGQEREEMEAEERYVDRGCLHPQINRPTCTCTCIVGECSA